MANKFNVDTTATATKRITTQKITWSMLPEVITPEI